MTELFCCYEHASAAEIIALVEELRLRGISVWRDQDGGFLLGDNTHAAARGAIGDRERTFGLLFYASAHALESAFIRRIEIDEAIRRKRLDPDFLLFSVARGLSFADLSRCSLANWGEDLALYHSCAIHEREAEGIAMVPVQTQLVAVANQVLEYWVASLAAGAAADVSVGFNLCTRAYTAPPTGTWLDVDATELLQDATDERSWRRLAAALVDIRARLRRAVPVPRLSVTGSKHLTAGFLLGRAFPPPVVREIQTPQGGDVWTTSCAAGASVPFDVVRVEGSTGSDILFVEINATEKDVRGGVQRHVQRTGVPPFASVRIHPCGGPSRGAIASNTVACGVALLVRDQIARLVAERPAREIHLSYAGPQALSVFLGHHLDATLPIQLYEFDGAEYYPSLRLDHRDLK